jgi:hypothetical protein
MTRRLVEQVLSRPPRQILLLSLIVPLNCWAIATANLLVTNAFVRTAIDFFTRIWIESWASLFSATFWEKRDSHP